VRIFKLILFALVLTWMTFNAEAQTSGNENWDARFGVVPGVNGTVNAVVSSGSAIYIGGRFTAIGSVSATNLAQWDGAQWAPLGAGVDGTVLAIAVSANGDVYAGGTFSAAGGVSATNIAKWDGANWASVGIGAENGVSSRVYAIATSGGDVYVGGSFSKAGSTNTRGIAKWNGSSWSALGSGISGSLQEVKAIAVSGGNVYVGGTFDHAGGVSVNYIAKWDGNNWSALGGGSANGVQGTVTGIATDGMDVYVVGAFERAGGPTGVAAVHVARWNGATWSGLGAGVGEDAPTVPSVSTVVATSGTVWVGGNFQVASGVRASRIAKWDGTSWSAFSSGIGGTASGTTVNAIAVSGNSTYVGGVFPFAGGVSASNLAKWDGNNWSAISVGGLNTVSGAIAVSGSLVYVAAGNTASEPYFVKWNGSQWSAVDNSVSNQFLGSQGLVSLSAIAINGTNIYVGGSGFTNIGGVKANGIVKWDGTRWSALGSGLSDGPFGQVRVNAIAIRGTDIYVGGVFTNAGGTMVNNIARWDGNNWSALGSGVSGVGFSGPSVNALAISGTNLYAGGSFSTAGGISARSVAKWDGNNWSALGDGVGSIFSAGTVNALAIRGNDVYVGGSFGHVGADFGGVTANNVAKWNGTNWSALADGITGGFQAGVLTLAIHPSGILYAGGQFTTAGSGNATNIAKWDGTAWSTLGAGAGINGREQSDLIDQGVMTMALAGADLYVGGVFTMAGGKRSTYFAHWTETNLPVAPSIGTARAGKQMVISWPASAAGFTLQVTDTLGPSANWTPAPETPTQAGDQNTVSVNSAAGSKFYRLQK
jgi:hypothetical protein